MKKFRKYIVVLLFALLALVITSCGDDVDEITLESVHSIITIANRHEVKADLDLIKERDGVTITWSSSNLDVVSDDGKIIRPKGDNVKVVMTATLTIGNKIKTKTIEVTVIGVPKEVFKVTFNYEGVSAQNVNEGDKASLPTAPTKDYHSFDGWFLDEEEYDFNTPVEKDITLEAGWTRTHHTVTYDLGYETEDKVDLEVVLIGEKATKPANPIRDKYEFVGWFVGEVEYDFDGAVEAEVELVAKWNKTHAKVSFDLGYKTDDKIDEQSVKVGEKAIKPSDPSRDRFVFGGWYLEGLETEFDFNSAITDDIAIFAKWDQLEVTVSFNLAYDDLTLDPQAFPIGGKAEEPTKPAREYYEFLGWFHNNLEYDFDTVVLSDVNLFAQWKQVKAIIIFDYNYDDITEEEIVNTDVALTKPADPVRDGYLFMGWEINNAPYDFDLPVTRNLTLVAHWAEDVQYEAKDVVLVAPEKLTHYVGSEFNPYGEVYAYYAPTNEPLDVVEKDRFFIETWPGDYWIEFEVVQAPEVTVRIEYKVIDLSAEPYKTNIPETLSSEPIEIVFWHSNGSEIDNLIKKYAGEFKDMMGAMGYNISILVEKPASTYDDLRTHVINAIKGSELPNLVQNYPDHVVEYNNNGVILPLTPYIFHPIYGMGDEPNESIYDIVGAYRAENRSNNLIGDYLSLPFNKSTEVATYNKTFFDTVLRGQPMPETWQDLFALFDDIMKIKDDQIDAISARWTAAGKALIPADIQNAKDKFVPFTYDSSSNGFITLTRQFGGKYTSRDDKGKGKVEFINDQTERMLQFFAGDNDGVFTVPTYWGAKYGSDVSKYGTTIFSVGSTAGARYNVPVAEGVELFEVAMIPVPYDKFNPNSRVAIQQGTNISLTTAGTDQQKLVSWLFLKYLTSTDVQADFAIATGYFPVRESSYLTETYVTYLAGADIELANSYQAAGMTKSEYEIAYTDKVKAMAARAGSLQRNYWFYDDAFIGSSKAREEVGIAFDRVILYTGSDLKTEINNALQAAKEETERIIGK